MHIYSVVVAKFSKIVQIYFAVKLNAYPIVV